MEINLAPELSKQEVFSRVENLLGSLSLHATIVDKERPWGGFFVIDESETNSFVSAFFPDLDSSRISQNGQHLSPKILILEPGKRLSWQYHHRRAELWRAVRGPIGIISSATDTQGAMQNLSTGETIQFDRETRHRGIGLESWGVIAEIWQHTDTNNLSDESDIVRVEDDFGR